MNTLKKKKKKRQGCQLSCIWCDTHAFSLNLTVSRSTKKSHAKL